MTRLRWRPPWVGTAGARPVHRVRSRPHRLHAGRAGVAASTAVESVGFGDGPFRLDPIPRVIGADDWTGLAAGLTQRVHALDAWCADVYGERRIVRDGVVPARVIDTIDTLEPDLAGVSAAALDRDRGPRRRARPGRAFLVLEDNVRTPSRDGLRDRGPYRDRVAARAGPGSSSLDGLRGACSSRYSARDARVVLTDGPDNSATGSTACRPTSLDIPLPASPRAASTCRVPVDVVYRRTDEDRCATAPIGRLLARAVARGPARLVNAFGTGVADDKLVHAYVEDMVRYYLGEEPLLRSVPHATTSAEPETLASRSTGSTSW